jgi:hypothetical protein
MVKAAQDEMDRLLEEQEMERAAFAKRQATARLSIRSKRRKAELLLENIDLDRARSLEREMKSIEEFDRLRAERDKGLEVGSASSESGAVPSSDAVLGLMPSEFVVDGFPVGSGLAQDPSGEWNFLPNLDPQVEPGSEVVVAGSPDV